jgi:hypothetical protein
MSSVDTGWVTDMHPLGLGPTARAHETFVGACNLDCSCYDLSDIAY